MALVQASDPNRKIPKKFYVVIPFSPDYELGLKAMKDVARGVLEGVQGISDTSGIIMQWYGIGREAILAMDADQLLKLNQLSRVQYENPEYLVSNGMAALYRIFDKKNRVKYTNESVASSLADYVKSVATAKNKSKDLHALAKPVADALVAASAKLEDAIDNLPQDADDRKQVLRTADLSDADLKSLSRKVRDAEQSVRSFASNAEFDRVSMRDVNLFLSDDVTSGYDYVREAVAKADAAMNEVAEYGFDDQIQLSFAKLIDALVVVLAAIDQVSRLRETATAELKPNPHFQTASYEADRVRSVLQIASERFHEVKTVKGLVQLVMKSVNERSPLKSIPAAEWDKLLRGALLEVGRLYKDEGEWLVKDQKLLVPKGSTLYLPKVDLPERILREAEDETLSGADLFVYNDRVKRHRHLTNAIKDLNLASRYTIKNISPGLFQQARVKWGQKPKKLAASVEDVWFHGSKTRFDSFKSQFKSTVQKEASETPLFFTKDEKFARDYAGGRGFVYTVKVKAKNPFDTDLLLTDAAKKSSAWPPDRNGLTPLGQELYDDLENNRVFADLVNDEDWWSVFGDSYGLWSSLLKMHYDIMETKEMKQWVKAHGFDSFYVTGDGPKNLAVLDPAHIEIVSVEPVSKLSAASTASESDLLDAIQHADLYGEGWTLDDFKVIPLGEQSLKRIATYDDFSSWVDIDPKDYEGLSVEDRLAMLTEFRGPQWVERARKWLTEGVPPIVVIEAPVVSENELYRQIGDGRGRVNFALAMGLKKLPVVLMKWKHKIPVSGAVTSASSRLDSYFEDAEDIVDAVESSSPSMDHVEPVKTNSDAFSVSVDLQLAPDESPYNSPVLYLGDDLMEVISDDLDEDVDRGADWKLTISGKKVSVEDIQRSDEVDGPGEIDLKTLKKTPTADFSLEVDADARLQDVLDRLEEGYVYFVTRVSGEEYVRHPMSVLHGRRVTWAHTRSKVVWIDADKINFMEGNQWSLDHAAGVLQAMKDGGAFEVPAGRVRRISAEDVASSQKYEESGELSYQLGMTKPWEENDIGSLTGQLIDGNHRAAAAIAMGETKIPVYVGELSGINDEKTTATTASAAAAIAQKPNGRPKGSFVGSPGSWKYTEGYPLGLNGGWGAYIGLSSQNGWQNLSVEGATEHSPEFLSALKEMVAAYPELLDFVVSFDGPFTPVKDLLATGKAPVFLHGTSSKLVPSIMKDGIRPRGDTGAKPSYGGDSKPSLPDRVYLTTQRGMANFAAAHAARVHGGEPVVLEVLDVDMSKALPDEDSGAKTAEESLAKLGSIAYRGVIPPSAIRGPVKASAATTPREFRLMFRVPDPSIPNLGDQLRSGVLKGVTGITDAGPVLQLRMFGQNRNAMLIMPGDEVLATNDLTPIRYDDPEAWLANDMAVALRVLGDGWTKDRVIRRILQGAEEDKQSWPFMRVLANLNVFPESELAEARIDSVNDFAKAWFALTKPAVEAARERDKEWATPEWLDERYGPMLDLTSYEHAIRRGLHVLAKLFVWEGEWLVNDKTLKVPKGSRLVLIDSPNTRAFVEAEKPPYKLQWAKKNLMEKAGWSLGEKAKALTKERLG